MRECFVYMCASASQVCSAYRGQKGALNALKLKLNAAVTHHMGSRNWTQVFWKNSQCF